MKNIILLIGAVAMLFSLSVGVNSSSVQADEIQDAKRKLEFLEEKRAIELTIENLQNLLKELPKKYGIGSDAVNSGIVKAAYFSNAWEAVYRRSSGYGECVMLSVGDIKISNGEISIIVKHPRDGPFSFRSAFRADRQNKGAANGYYVTVVYSGHIGENTGELVAVMSGEDDCEATWDLSKKSC